MDRCGSTDETPKPTVGVVIRTLNESALLGSCLESLRRQRGDHQLDILVVDSGSTDDTLQIARAHGARTLEVAPEDFDYSKTLNLGIGEVRGDLILILSAHAIPLDDMWVTTMTAPFADPRVAGVASKQVPWPDAPFNEAHRVRQAFPDEHRFWTGEASAEIVFSNAASAIRRSVWREHAFTLPAAEDLEWAQRTAAAGWTIVYEPTAGVNHSHNETPRALARRLIDLNRRQTIAGRRTIRRTLGEAARYLYRDMALVVRLDEPVLRRLVHATYVARTAAYYITDFSRSGSTAELSLKLRRAGGGR